MERAWVVILAIAGSIVPEIVFFLFPIFTEWKGLIEGIEKLLVLLLKCKIVSLCLSKGFPLAYSDGLVEGLSFSPDVDHVGWNKYKNYTDRKG